MFKHFVLVLACGVLTACMSVPGTDYALADWDLKQDIAAARVALRQTDDCCKTISALPFAAVELEKELRYTIDNSYPRYSFPDGASRVLALELPKRRYPMVLEVRSLIIDSVFAPTLLLLDENFEPLRLLGSEAFEVQHNKLMVRDNLRSELLVMPDEHYLVIYSSQAQQQQFTLVPHPEKMRARSRTTVPPAIPDLEFRHAPVGHLVLSMTTAQSPTLLKFWSKP